MAIIDSLEVALGFKADTATLNSFIHSLGELNLSSVISAAGLGGLVEALNKVMDVSDKIAMSLGNLSNITGVSTQQFQAWDKAAQQFGMNAGETNQIISNIQKEIINQELTGQGHLGMWQSMLGVNAYGREGDPVGVLKEMVKNLEKLSVTQRRAALDSAGIDENIVQLIGHLEEVDKESVNTAAEIARIREYHQAITKAANDWLVVLLSLGAAVAPIFTAFASGLDVLIQMTTHWQLAIPLLTAIVALSWNWARAMMANPLFLPATLTALGITGLGLLNEKFKWSDMLAPSIANADNSSDNSKNIQMRNEFNFNGGTPDENYHRTSEAIRNVIGESEYQGNLPNY